MYTRSSSRQRPYTTVVVWVVALAAVWGFDQLSGGVARSMLATLISPLERVVYTGVSHTSVAQWVSTKSALIQQNKQLTARVNELERRDALVSVLYIENEHLRSLLGGTSTKPILAYRLSFPSQTPYGTIRIGKGTQDGVEVGMKALYTDGYMIGTVTAVESHTATITLVFAPARETEVIIGSIAAVLMGRGGTTGYAIVPKGSGIAVGDVVKSTQYPARAVGTVSAVFSDPTSADERVYVGFPFGLEQAESVALIP